MSAISKILRQMALLNYPSHVLIFLQTLKELESAIVSSPLGLNPRVDGQRLIAAIPP